MNGSSEPPAMPVIPDHQLIRLIGEGSYGQIWLARNVVGTYRAVKIVFRAKFQDERPYEREFKGIRQFEPISRSHRGLVDVLQIGRNDDAGYFYYIMELADDEVAGRDFHPDNYKAKTLSVVWEARGRLSAGESIEIAMSLAAALAHMHRHGLVHRDVKPSNIIFVQGQPKLADIGLVVPVTDARTFVGTEGYIPPEGPGSVQADIYSLGKVLYEISTGQDRQSFPELPQELGAFSDREQVVELNEIVVKACANTPEARYARAEDLRNDLQLLRDGRSVKRLRFVERQLARTARVAAVASVLAITAVIAAFGINRVRNRERQLLADSIAISGIRLFEDGNLHASLPFFGEAMRLEENNAAAVATHRLRIASALDQSPRRIQWWQHAAEVKDIRFDPAGERLLVAAGRLAQVVDVRTGQPRGGEFVTAKKIETAVFSPDGATVAIAHGSWLRMDSADARTNHFEIQAPGQVFSAEFNSAGNMIVISCSKLAQLIDARTGSFLGELRGHTGGVIYASFSPDGTKVVTASQDGTARLWSLDSGETLYTLPHTQWVYDAGFSPDGRSVVTATSDHLVRVWDVKTGNQLPWRMEHRGSVRRARFSPDGQWIVSAGFDRTVRFWNARTGAPSLSTLNLHAPALVAAFSPDGCRVAAANQRGEINLWDVAPRPAFHAGPGAVGGNGERYATFRSNTFRIWNAHNDSPASDPITTSEPIETIRISDDSDTVIAISKRDRERTAAVHAYGKGRGLRMFRLSDATDKSVLSADGKTLLMIGRKSIALWNTDTGAEKFRVDEPALHGAVSPDNRLVVLVTKRNLVGIDANSGRQTFRAVREELPISAMTFSADSSRLVLVSSDKGFSAGAAQIWDARQGKPLCSVTQHTDGVRSAVFSWDGKLLGTGSEDSQFGIWDAAIGRAHIQPVSLLWPVQSVSFSADANWLLATTWFETQVFEVRTGRAATPVIASTGRPQRNGFCAGGRRIWIQTTRGLYFWHLPTHEGSPGDVLSLADQLGVTVPAHFKWDPAAWSPADVRRRCEQEFSKSDQGIEAWHRARAAACEQDNDWFGARFHLERLLMQKPQDPELPVRLATARSRWRRSIEVAP